MTDDLVKRLRKRGIAELDEAADCIEKLEAAMREILKPSKIKCMSGEELESFLLMVQSHRQIARKALEGKDD
jgi:hypothetical protein